MARTDISARSLCKLLGISYPAMLHYLRGENIPRLDALMRFADWFAVPLDYLCGRCDEKTSRMILKDYPTHFMELRRAGYEDYINIRPKLSLRKTKTGGRAFEFPYPYNLLDEIDDSEIRGKVDKDVESKLEDSINSLNDRDQRYILDYYKRGYSIDKIADGDHVSRQWVWSSLNKAVRRLKFIYQRF